VEKVYKPSVPDALSFVHTVALRSPARVHEDWVDLHKSSRSGQNCFVRSVRPGFQGSILMLVARIIKIKIK